MPQEKMTPGAEPAQEKLIPKKDASGVWRLGPVRHRAWSGSYHRSSGKGKSRKDCLADFWRNFEVNRCKGTRRTEIAEAASPEVTLTLDSMMADVFDEFRKHCQQRFDAGELARRSLDAYISMIYPADTRHGNTRSDAIRLSIEMGRFSVREAAQSGFIVGYFRSVRKAYPGVADLQFKVLSAVYTWLTDEMQLFDISPMKLIKKPKYVVAKPQRALIATARAELSDALQADRQARQWPYYVVMLMLATGVRPGEILALRWCDILDIDGEHTILHICGHTERVKGRGRDRVDRRKAGNPYYITLPDWGARILREWRDAVYVTGDDSALCFTKQCRNKIMQPIVTDEVCHVMQERLAGTAVHWVRPGNLRDTVATEVAGRTGDAGAASAQLGHAAAASVATRHYIDAEGYYRFVVDYSVPLEHLNPESDTKVTIRAAGAFVTPPQARVLSPV